MNRHVCWERYVLLCFGTTLSLLFIPICSLCWGHSYDHLLAMRSPLLLGRKLRFASFPALFPRVGPRLSLHTAIRQPSPMRRQVPRRQAHCTRCLFLSSKSMQTWVRPPCGQARTSLLSMLRSTSRSRPAFLSFSANGSWARISCRHGLSPWHFGGANNCPSVVAC